MLQFLRTKSLFKITAGTAGIAALATFIAASYTFTWAWTGFNKTLWDWMQLLIIPMVLALAAFWFNRVERKNEQSIALDAQQETALQTYLDHMTELLLKEGLRTSKPGDEARNVARARTLTALPRLDPNRKHALMQFLSEARLTNIIDLSGADLSGADLDWLDLSEATLSGANLSRTSLEYTNFKNASLHHANLTDSSLWNTKLNGTDLSHAQLNNSSLIDIDFSNTEMFVTDLTGATLIRTDLDKAHGLIITP